MSDFATLVLVFVLLAREEWIKKSWSTYSFANEKIFKLCFLRSAGTSCTYGGPARVQWKSGWLIYRLWIIRRLIKPTRWPHGIPKIPPLTPWSPLAPPSTPSDPLTGVLAVAVDPMTPPLDPLGPCRPNPLIPWDPLGPSLDPWDPVGLPLDPLGPCRPTPWPHGPSRPTPLPTPWPFQKSFFFF